MNNLTKAYSNQLRSLRKQINEGFEDELDKWQNRAMYTSAGLGLGSLASSATGVGLPVGAAAAIASGGIDLANAGVYGARALYNLAKGDTEKAKEMGWEAGLNALFAIPFIGDVIQGGKAAKSLIGAEKAAEAVKASNSGIKAVETAAKAAPEAAKVAQTAQRGARTVNKTPGIPRQRPTTVGTKTRVRQTVPAGRVASPAAKVGKAAIDAEKAVKAVASGSKIAKAVKAVRAIGKGSIGAAAGAAIATAVAKALRDREDRVPDEEKITINRVPAGVQHGRIGEWEAGIADYAKSVHPTSRMADDRFGGAWNQFSINLQHNAFRNLEAQKRGLPTFENYEPSQSNLSSKIKFAVNKYLNSKEGSELKNHLDNVKKTIER